MKPKHLIFLTALLTAALILYAAAAPAGAADSATNSTLPADETAPITTHPERLSLQDIREGIAEIITDATKSPAEKLEEQTKIMGMSAKLKLYLEAPRDEETGEPIYDNYIPVISPVLSFLGLSDAIENPYTQDEGQAAYDRYLEKFIAFYQPSGEFGGPIA